MSRLGYNAATPLALPPGNIIDLVPTANRSRCRSAGNKTTKDMQKWHRSEAKRLRLGWLAGARTSRPNWDCSTDTLNEWFRMDDVDTVEMVPDRFSTVKRREIRGAHSGGAR